MEGKVVMNYPEKLGQPCWATEQVSKVISSAAHTSAKSAPYFLAAHSPFESITDAKSAGRYLTEEEVFEEIFSPARGEVQAFVKGEPGTGKSHLIRWLKLRSEHAKASGAASFANFTFVLVSRGNGSLKDALGQIVDQLGTEFSRHATRIQGAIDNLSDHAARDTLLSSLALEIGTHWPDRHPDIPMPKSLQHLAAALGPTTGFGKWIKRDGGVIHRVIQRLTEDSSVDEREQSPEFFPTDLNINITYLSPNTTPQNVINLADDLTEEDDLRESAAKILNMALTDAVRGLTGLRGSDLLEIFTEIRRELGPTKQLAVFIEDVSVGVINEDIINAFEPREIDEHCRMVAVLGITNGAWNHPRFPPNQKQRATFAFEVGGQVTEAWAANTASVAAFTARYLNAVRMDDNEIRSLAVARFSGDVARSACDGCDHQDQCFAIFGNSELPNGVKIGLFPFNSVAPQSLLAALNNSDYKSQRGLLDHIMLKALDQSYASLKRHEFPQQNHFPIRTLAHRFDWSAFSAHYLGGANWGTQEKQRLRFLANYWTDASSVSDAAGQLEPMLLPLGLPKFSGEVIKSETCKKCGKSPCTCGIKLPPICNKCNSTPCICSKEDPILNGYLGAIENWSAGENLLGDAKFREFVGTFIRNSIAWSNQRVIPITVSTTGAERLISGHAFIKIEGQIANPRNQLYLINFDRDQETKELLETLAIFECRGKNWDFPHGEIHKRKLSRWLRNNAPKLAKSLNPDPPSLVETARKCAIQILAIIATLRDRSKKTPTNATERLDGLFNPLWDASSRPVVLSPELEQIITDLESKHASIRSFVIREFGAGQGDAEPKDFIDPSPILEILNDFSKSPTVEPPPTKVAEGFWKSRFGPVSRLEAYASLSDRLQKERMAIQSAVDTADTFTKATGFDGQNLREDLGNCLKELAEVIGLQRGGQHTRGILPLPNPEFDQLWKTQVIQRAETRESWCRAVERASKVSKDDDPVSLLTFDPRRFKEFIAILRIIENFLELIDKEMQYQENHNEEQGDSRSELLNVLKQIEGMNLANQSEEPTQTDEDPE
jgi:hypothetical protein